MFQIVDSDGDGMISREELWTVLQVHCKQEISGEDTEETIRNRMYTW